jgi:hypothetical protein
MLSEVASLDHQDAVFGKSVFCTADLLMLNRGRNCTVYTKDQRYTVAVVLFVSIEYLQTMFSTFCTQSYTRFFIGEFNVRKGGRTSVEDSDPVGSRPFWSAPDP